MPLIDLVNQAEVMKQFYPCGLYQYQLTIMATQLQPKMVWSPLIAPWRVYRLHQVVTLQFTAPWQKYNCPFALTLK